MAKQFETDVVVVAAGLSGLAAAISAAENGASVICLEKAANTGGAANMGMGPCAANSPVQRANMINLTAGELFRRHMFYTHYQVDAKLVKAYYDKSGDTIQWLMDMGVQFHHVGRAFGGEERSRGYSEGLFTWHVVQPEDGSEPGPRAATTMTKRMTERAQDLGVEFMLETPGTGLIKDEETGAIVGVKAVDKAGEEIEISCKAVIVATGGFGHNVIGGGHTPVTMELMYQLPDNMNHFYVEGAFRQPCYWCNRLGERFMPEDEVYNTTFVGNAINHLPGKVGFAIFDANMLRRWKKNGPDIVSHVHPHDLYEGFEAQWNADLETYKDDEGNPYIAQADTLEELAEQLGIDPEGLVAAVDEYNELCAEGYDSLFEKGREYMIPLEEGPFYGCKQFCGAYGTLGGVLVNHKLEVMTDDYETIPGLYCVGTDACTIYGDSYNFCIPGNTMGFCLNSGRIAGENAAELAFGGGEDGDWDDDGDWD